MDMRPNESAALMFFGLILAAGAHFGAAAEAGVWKAQEILVHLKAHGVGPFLGHSCSPSFRRSPRSSRSSSQEKAVTMLARTWSPTGRFPVLLVMMPQEGGTQEGEGLDARSHRIRRSPRV